MIPKEVHLLQVIELKRRIQQNKDMEMHIYKFYQQEELLPTKKYYINKLGFYLS